VDVLREIAETCEIYTSLSKRELRTIIPEALKEDVTKLLEKLRILVLLDNFETISKSNQVEILQFFNNIRGSSQILISTRYRPDWFLEHENDEMYRMTHVLIRVDGLSTSDASTLVQEFLSAKALPQSVIDDGDIVRLTEITQNNPKTILVLLGLVEQGVSLAHLLDSITSGTPDADRMYDMIIDHAWEELLSEDDKAVLMAKAFFSHSVREDDLGQIAGVDSDHLREAIKTLAAISFFESERSQQQTFRIRTHALAQEFAKRVLHDHPDFAREAEEHWWTSYGPRIVQQARQTPYESLQSDLEEDVANVLEHLEYHIGERSPYCRQAVELFGDEGGLGYTLRSWSRYDDILRIAESFLEFVIAQKDAELIGTCALRLMAPVYKKRGKVEDVNRWIGQAIEQNTRLQDRWLEAVIETTRGTLYRHQGFLRAEEQAYQKALAIFLDLGSTPDIISMYRRLGTLTICLATQDFEEAIDTSGTIQAELAKAEHYFKQAEALLISEKTDQNTHEIPLELRDQRAIIARLRGDLDQARDLLQSCVGQLHSSYSVANLYREMALVERLAGNTDLAHSYEAKGTNLLRQLGLSKISHTSCYTHGSKVIDHMKRERTW
jgi:tetratricopeptide (TPR) repeat protein